MRCYYVNSKYPALNLSLEPTPIRSMLTSKSNNSSYSSETHTEHASNNSNVSTLDLSSLSVDERKQVLAVMQKAKEFEAKEEMHLMRQPTEGILFKYTNVVKGWQYRWFTLNPDTGNLDYFEKEEYKGQRPRGFVNLAGAVISPSDEDSQTFTVNAANGEVYRLRAHNAKERQHWVNRLRATAEYHTEDLGRISHLPANPVLNASASSVSHDTIAETNSISDVQQMLRQLSNQQALLASCTDEFPLHGEQLTPLNREMLLLKATAAASINSLTNCLSLLIHKLETSEVTSLTTSRLLSSSLPNSPQRTAREARLLARVVASPEILSPTDSFVSVESSLPMEPLSFPRKDSRPAVGSVDHSDEILDEEQFAEADIGAVEEHKGVILHVLSQLKLGMDLTKVVLPTFILERRSLLEMFADCMAHPDLFLSIVDTPTPEQRMLQVVEWYLTSFHASRKGSLAKKPYNPVIGETFHCSWDVMLDDADNPNCRPTKLYYCAEQVSHHPPVSAFYFECPEKQICMNASLWTKSKFMGLSIGVMMIGKLTLSLIDYDEQYEFALPSAYARSILTVPWVELGDRVSISCQKTGYSAAVTFHTKPFYGGKLHCISCEVKNADNEVISKVQGEWNGTLEFVHTLKGQRKIIDTQDMKTYRKYVKPIHLQHEYESRRLWKAVTVSLKNGNVEAATQAKRFLEERQRQSERQRKETNTVFPTKYFEQSGDTWTYHSPLQRAQMYPTA